MSVEFPLEGVKTQAAVSLHSVVLQTEQWRTVCLQMCVVCSPCVCMYVSDDGSRVKYLCLSLTLSVFTGSAQLLLLIIIHTGFGS